MDYIYIFYVGSISISTSHVSIHMPVVCPSEVGRSVEAIVEVFGGSPGGTVGMLDPMWGLVYGLGIPKQLKIAKFCRIFVKVSEVRSNSTRIVLRRFHVFEPTKHRLLEKSAVFGLVLGRTFPNDGVPVH